jgi:hypothetical protein
MIACPRWVLSAVTVSGPLVVTNAWNRHVSNKVGCSATAFGLRSGIRRTTRRPGTCSLLRLEMNAVNGISATSAREIHRPDGSSNTAFGYLIVVHVGDQPGRAPRGPTGPLPEALRDDHRRRLRCAQGADERLQPADVGVAEPGALLGVAVDLRPINESLEAAGGRRIPLSIRCRRNAVMRLSSTSPYRPLDFDLVGLGGGAWSVIQSSEAGNPGPDG